MTSARDQYAELLSMTKRYLLQEHSLAERILADNSSYTYFRALASQRQETARNAASPAALQSSAAPKKESVPPQRQAPQPVAASDQVRNPVQQRPAEPLSKEQQRIPVQPSQSAIPAPAQAAPKAEADLPSTDPTQVHGGRFSLVPPGPAAAVPLDDFRKIAFEHLPHLKLIEIVPDDAEAQNIAKAWENDKAVPQAVILSFNEPEKHRVFLNHIAIALQMSGISSAVMPASRIDQGTGWGAFIASPQLKIVIASGTGIETLPSLKKYQKETAKNGRHQLGDHPLLLLSDLSFYLQEPSLKPSLWKTIKEHLAALPKAHE